MPISTLTELAPAHKLPRVTKLPSISGERTVRALKRVGFIELRQKGSHVSLEKRAGDTVFRVVVPLHDTLAKGTPSDILKRAGLTADEFKDLL